MTENRAGRETETRKSADQRGDLPTKRSGDEIARSQPPNPEPAEGAARPRVHGGYLAADRIRGSEAARWVARFTPVVR